MPRQPDVPATLSEAPFRWRTARELGVSADTLRGPLFRAPFRGVRVAAALADTPRLRAAAALLALPPGAALSCHTAAELRGLPVPSSAAVHADIPRRERQPRIEGISPHRRDVESVLVQGLPAAAPAPTFLELAAYLTLVDLVIVGDALVRRGWIKLDALRVAVGRAAHQRGVRSARRAADLVRERVDSPMETRLRLMVVLAGLPCPVPGFRVIVDGQIVGWFDLAFPEYRIVIEYDGDLHRTLKKKWRMDVATRDELRALGWTVIVLTWDDYAVFPDRTLGRIARELVRAGCPYVPLGWRSGNVGLSSLPAQWRTAFPGTGRQAWDWADAPAG